MKTMEEIKQQLAALFYYQSAEKEKGLSFENLDQEKQRPFLSLAEAMLVNIDKLGLCLTAQSKVDHEAAEALLHDKIEAEVRSFFEGLKIWKKGAIPQEELVARVWSVWKNL